MVSFRVPARVRAGALVVFSGQVTGGPGDVILVQRRVQGLWRPLVRGHAGGRGQFALTLAAPARPGGLIVRAVVSGAQGLVALSAARTLRVLALPKGAHPVVVSERTQVLDSSVVSSVPAPGQAGTLRYAGGNEVRVGQIIAIGVGGATPQGFLGRVTKVASESGQTIVSTRPATLLEAVPSGSLDATLEDTNDARARVAGLPGFQAAAVTCSGGVKASITPDVSFNAGLELASNWSLFGGLQSASLTAHASANTSLTAVVAGSASCKLEQTTLVKFPGPTEVVFVGFVPVVLTSEITVFLDGEASASASMSTSASAGFSASAGVGWNKNRGFYPISSFNSHFGFTPPAISAGASVAANLTPTVDVLLYGVAGPEIALESGLALNANIAGNPWWSLTAPVDLTAGLAIPALDLKSPTLHVYRHTFPIANAGGPFGRGGGSGGAGGGGSAGASVTVTDPGGQTGVLGVPANLQIQASDTDGGALHYDATGLPAGLSINTSTGLISGTPDQAGDATVTVSATDATGPTGQTSFSWSIHAAPTALLTVEMLQRLGLEAFTKETLFAKFSYLAEYEIVARNASEASIDLEGIADANCTNIRGPGKEVLAPGEATIYTCEHQSDEEGTWTNVATVTANGQRQESNQVEVYAAAG
jgi:Putative Ig domain